MQYPGVDEAIKSDLDNAEMLYGLFAAVAQRNLDVKGVVDELRARMGDELDYRLEAAAPDRVRRALRRPPVHPRARVVPERSAQRVLTSEWVDGLRWAEFEDVGDRGAAPASRPRSCSASPRGRSGATACSTATPSRQLPVPPEDGTVTFLDFGLVKRWTPGELESLEPVLDADPRLPTRN